VNGQLRNEGAISCVLHSNGDATGRAEIIINDKCVRFWELNNCQFFIERGSVERIEELDSKKDAITHHLTGEIEFRLRAKLTHLNLNKASV
jgi:hypothetical protein